MVYNNRSIAVVTSSDLKNLYPIGGTLSYVRNFAEIYEGKILLLSGSLNKNLFIRRELNLGTKIIDDIPIIELRRNHKIPERIRNLFYITKGLKKISNLIKNYDLVYAHAAEEILPLVIFNKNIKLIYHMHGATNPLKISKYKIFRRPLFQNIYNRLILIPVLKRSKLIIAINQECVDLLHDYKIKTPYHILPNLINDNLFKPMDKTNCRNILKLESGKKYLLFIGRLSEVKGLRFLLNVINDLMLSTKPAKNFILIIIGEGEERFILEKQVKRLRLQNNVSFLGPIEYDKLPLYYNAADVFLLTSYHEGTPMVLLEAMATGIPIISSSAGNAELLLKNYSNGYVINNHTIKDWLMKIQENLKCEKNKTPFSYNSDLSFLNSL